MAKLTLATIDSEYASVTTLNANFDAIETALENTLSRDGTTPNAMGAALDMNGYSIINIDELNGVPASALTDLGSFVAQAEQAATNAGVSETNAASSASAASTSASNAASSAASAASSAASAASSAAAVGNVNGIVKGNGAGTVSAAVAGTDYLAPAAVGVTVQAYDANTAKTNATQTFTTPQRGTITVQNTVSSGFNCLTSNNFSCTPSAGGTFNFLNTGSAHGQSGYVFFDNSGGYAISLGATYQKMSSADLVKLNAPGKYLVSYLVVSSVAYCTVSSNLA